MSKELLFLRPNIQIEALFDQWYAWSHLIPPGTAARNISRRYLPILDSYIAAPAVHANALKNPKMIGGPFIDYGGGRVDEIREVRDRTRNNRGDLLALSKALDDLDALLKKQATGFSLHPLYSQTPDILRGYVELTYDLNDRPSYRLMERLLYASKYYDESAQSVMLSMMHGDDRPFVLSTPRLEDDHHLRLQVPFRDERLDFLFGCKTSPACWPEIREAGDAAAGSQDLFRSFFTSEPPPAYEPYQGDGLRWRYFGHACVLIEMQGVSILTDPVLSYTYDSNLPRYTYADLPESIDYVVITHNHQDHVLFETLLQLRYKIKHLVVPQNNPGALQDPSLRLMFQQIGFKNVIALEEFDKIDLPNGFLMGLPFFGEHSDLAIQSKSAYLLRVGKYGMLFAADSCNVEPRVYRHIHDLIGDIDVLFLGMECEGAPLSWLYGPLLSRRLERTMDESRRLNGSNFEQAIGMIDEFNCREVYVYAMGQEPWLSFITSLKYTPISRPITESNRLVEECQRRGILSERLFGTKESVIDRAHSR